MKIIEKETIYRITSDWKHNDLRSFKIYTLNQNRLR